MLPNSLDVARVAHSAPSSTLGRAVVGLLDLALHHEAIQDSRKLFALRRVDDSKLGPKSPAQVGNRSVTSVSSSRSRSFVLW